MSKIDKRKLTAKIVKSKELTALEKRYLESLIVQDMERKPEESRLTQAFRDSLLDKFNKRR